MKKTQVRNLTKVNSSVIDEVNQTHISDHPVVLSVGKKKVDAQMSAKAQSNSEFQLSCPQ